ncbi:MAG: hypothetical protein SV062_01000 [Thermodesulfobacteriota bacterium]|nr:hypothetical protein [Thermodesulfobacteriota bacterium]
MNSSVKKAYVFFIAFCLLSVIFTIAARSESEVETIKKNMEILQKQIKR